MDCYQAFAELNEDEKYALAKIAKSTLDEAVGGDEHAALLMAMDISVFSMGTKRFVIMDILQFTDISFWRMVSEYA